MRTKEEQERIERIDKEIKELKEQHWKELKEYTEEDWKLRLEELRNIWKDEEIAQMQLLAEKVSALTDKEGCIELKAKLDYLESGAGNVIWIRLKIENEDLIKELKMIGDGIALEINKDLVIYASEGNWISEKKDGKWQSDRKARRYEE